MCADSSPRPAPVLRQVRPECSRGLSYLRRCHRACSCWACHYAVSLSSAKACRGQIPFPLLRPRVSLSEEKSISLRSCTPPGVALNRMYTQTKTEECSKTVVLPPRYRRLSQRFVLKGPVVVVGELSARQRHPSTPPPSQDSPRPAGLLRPLTLCLCLCAPIIILARVLES